MCTTVANKCANKSAKVQCEQPLNHNMQVFNVKTTCCTSMRTRSVKCENRPQNLTSLNKILFWKLAEAL